MRLYNWCNKLLTTKSFAPQRFQFSNRSGIWLASRILLLINELQRINNKSNLSDVQARRRIDYCCDGRHHQRAPALDREWEDACGCETRSRLHPWPEWQETSKGVGMLQAWRASGKGSGFSPRSLVFTGSWAWIPNSPRQNFACVRFLNAITGSQDVHKFEQEWGPGPAFGNLHDKKLYALHGYMTSKKLHRQLCSVISILSFKSHNYKNSTRWNHWTSRKKDATLDLHY